MGYVKQTFDFLTQLSRNNNREWFKARKDKFDPLRKHWIEDMEKLRELLSHSDPEMGREECLKVYRIYRDTRFSPNKDPYKTYVSASLSPVTNQAHCAAGYYVQMGVGTGYTESGLYGGIWLPEHATLTKIRRAIVDNQEEFEEIINDPRLIEVAGTGWMAESLKNVPRGFDKDHPLAEVLKLKEYGKFAQRGREFFMQSDWVEQAADILSRFRPLVSFINYSIFEE